MDDYIIEKADGSYISVEKDERLDFETWCHAKYEGGVMMLERTFFVYTNRKKDNDRQRTLQGMAQEALPLTNRSSESPWPSITPINMEL